MIRRNAVVALTAVLALLVACPAVAGPATDQLRRSVDLVLKTLEDPEMRKEARTAERRASIRAIANEIFDFGEISQRALGRHWQGRTAAEREEFVKLFGDLLERSYIAKIESYSGERIVYAGEAADADVVIVRTKIVSRQGVETPLDYKMLRKGERWRAYDVNIEGVSLVANYRSQFNAILARQSYPELVARLRAKQDERPEARATGRLEPAATAPPPAAARTQGP